MPKTMSIGGATYDLFVRTHHDVVHDCQGEQSIALPLGQKIHVKEVIETCGGGASNTSVGLSRLGLEAGFAGVIGDDQWGMKMKENFEKEGISLDCMTIVEDEHSSFSIILSASSGERVILYNRGANTHLHDVTFDRETACSMDWVYLNHIQEESCEIQDDIIAMLAEGDEPRLTWNPGGCQIEVGLDAPNNKKLVEHTDLLILNREEACAFAKVATLEEALKALSDAGAKVVCITDGRNGTSATDGKSVYHCPIIDDIDVSDTTGAGDAFGCGMTWALIKGYDLPKALRAGTINAASVVSALGAQAGLLTDIEMEQKLHRSSLDVSNSSLA